MLANLDLKPHSDNPFFTTYEKEIVPLEINK
jgi:hypothetical protein